MKKDIKVSIIIPIYNVGKYLDQCLYSATNQTLKKCEIIIVNDGSTDNSLDIAYKYAPKYPLITVINQNNLGQGAARNRALEIAQGEYLYFLDGDDYIELNAMEELYNEAITNQLDLVLFDGDVFFDDNINNRKYRFNYQKKGEYPNVMDGQTIFAELINNNDYSCSPCLLFIKKSFLDSINLRFYEGIIHEDELFTFKLILQARKVKYYKKVLFHRRVRKGSTMTGKNYLRSFIGYKTVLCEMLDFISKIHISSADINNSINKKVGYIYGSAINNLCYMDNKTRKNISKIIKELKIIALKYKFFNRKEYILFYYCSWAYYILRKLYDKVKVLR